MPGRRWWVGIGVVVTAAVVAGVIAWPHAQRYTGVAPPLQFDEPIDVRLPGGAEGRVAGIAHNAGNNLRTLRAAITNGADVIEVDVISARGHLVAGREYQPLPGLARLLFRGPTLQDAWDAASPAGLLKLDLKQSDPTFLDQLVAFLSPRAGLRPVVVSSPDRAALVLLNHRLPAVTLLSSVSDPAALNRLRSDPFLVSIIAGVSAFHGLVDTNLVAWAHQAGLKVIAWTVDGGTRLVELIRQGVDGITTANLAVLRELGGQRGRPSRPASRTRPLVFDHQGERMQPRWSGAVPIRRWFCMCSTTPGRTAASLHKPHRRPSIVQVWTCRTCAAWWSRPA